MGYVAHAGVAWACHEQCDVAQECRGGSAGRGRRHGHRWCLGFIAIFSIGLGLLITAGLFGVAALGLAPSAAQIAPLLAARTAVGLLIAGFTITGVF